MWTWWTDQVSQLQNSNFNNIKCYSTMLQGHFVSLKKKMFGYTAVDTHQSQHCKPISFFTSVISLVDQFWKTWIQFKVWWAVWGLYHTLSGMFVPIRDLFVPLTGTEPSRRCRLLFLKLQTTITVKPGMHTIFTSTKMQKLNGWRCKQYKTHWGLISAVYVSYPPWTPH